MTQLRKIIQSPLFARQKKKLHKPQAKDLDNAVKTVFENPSIGDPKVGDLQGVRVYKFKSRGRQILMSYEVAESVLYLYTVGSHENFYRELKRYLK